MNGTRTRKHVAKLNQEDWKSPWKWSYSREREREQGFWSDLWSMCTSVCVFLCLVQPKIVEALLGYELVQVSCGASHILAVTNEGEVFSWGRGDNGEEPSGHLRTPNAFFWFHFCRSFTLCSHVADHFYPKPTDTFQLKSLFWLHHVGLGHMAFHIWSDTI